VCAAIPRLAKLKVGYDQVKACRLQAGWTWEADRRPVAGRVISRHALALEWLVREGRDDPRHATQK
jgi:hypothetical protein